MIIDKKKIYNFVETQNSSVRNIEEKAGLSRNAIHNILADKSKNPGLETIVKIAKTLGCSVDDLLLLDSKKTATQINELPYNGELYSDVITFINKKYSKSKISMNNLILKDVLQTVDKIYEYSYTNNNQSLDTKFAEWFFQNSKF
ncbi:MAG: XRE family transcriptional regulator [Rickettsiales bacterium]|jgi:transcriptional regulator with XRE-family HTH domain|nr:XRE family transcriptional regulator [Rickettsiales bacterium]